MENSIFYNTHSIRFIRILFGFLAIFITILFLLVFLLKINDSVSFKEGLIYSRNPQIKINSPDAVSIVQVNVKEGQDVQKGDTLFVLKNVRTETDYDIAHLDIATLENKLLVLQKLIVRAGERKISLKQLLAIQSSIYQTDRNKTEQEIQTLNHKIALSTQQSDILQEKYQTDSILYAKGAISRLELTEQRNRKLDDRKGQTELQATYKQKNYDFENLAHGFQKTNNDVKRSIIDIDNQIIGYQREMLEIQAQIQNKKYNLQYIGDELGKLIIVAPVQGTISNVFNARQNQQLINKGEVLSIIAPKDERFYAKITLPENDLAYVKQGQEVNLKVDAYNYYKFGAVKGTITYVSPSDIDKSFYCLVNFKDYNQNIRLKAGYKLKGEVIIEEMLLIEYILKKLFNKLDDSTN